MDLEHDKNSNSKEQEHVIEAELKENSSQVSEIDENRVNETTNENGTDEMIENDGEDVKYITYIGETHEPSDVATHVGISDWQQGEDYDIGGQTYSGGLKVTVYNMFSALDGNSSNILNTITSEIHLALNIDEIKKLDEEEQYFEGKLVVGQETDGSPSTAVISILLDEEVYNSGEINCYSLNTPLVNVILTGKKEMIIKIVCQHRGNPFVIGIVNNDT